MTLLVATSIGLMVAIVRFVAPPWLSWPLKIYIDVIRGTPELVLLFFVYLEAPHTGFPLSPLTASIVALSIYNAAYLAEVIRSGLESVSRIYLEAARSTGLRGWSVFRWVLIPLGTRNMIPALIGQYVVLVKSTSLVSVIGVVDLVGAGKIIYAKYLNVFETLIAVGAVFLILNLVLSSLGARLQRRYGSAMESLGSIEG